MAGKILIIEDQEPFRNLFTAAFTQAGYEVTAVNNGQAGVDEALKGGYAAILTDLKMPGKDGLQVLSDLQQVNIKPANGPIFVVSSVTYPYAKDEVIRRGAAGFILKDSLEPREIVAQVKAAIKES